ncbi:chitin deacetylase [Lunasporangiospora selenospora]|uniref:Chitin deacetylase n=1 Tax=Lunasporangiospora selenospora TaxID=979761 RepID=A0A9P6G0F5_9FUNG|nr:chitin deacetylase [Lunasporangiospora selenospora]
MPSTLADSVSQEPDITGQDAWPISTSTPTTDSPEVREWVKLVDWSKVPNIPVRASIEPRSPPPCPEEESTDKEKEQECWWTCTGCVAEDDVTECPRPRDWGLTYDDGPQPGVTEVLMDELQARNVTATFFVTGTKSSQGPWLLQEAIKRGHHLASHSDIDNRVREIARQLGFRTVIWTPRWDTNDWQLEHKRITNSQVEGLFKSALDSVPDRETGVITLEHDGRRSTVDMAGTLLDMGIRQGMRPMDISKCLGDPVGYNEVPASAHPPSPKPDVSSKQPLTESSSSTTTSTTMVEPTLSTPMIGTATNTDGTLGGATPFPESGSTGKDGSPSSGAPALRLLKATKDCTAAFCWTVSVSLLLSFLVV